MWWPFSRARLDEETQQRVNRKCGLAVATLRNCRQANAANPAACSSLEAQVVHCHAEALCPAAAADYQRCFKRVVGSAGKLQYSECDGALQAMRKCLRRRGLDPEFRK